MTANVQQTSPRGLACASCGAAFSCTGDAACWCAAESFRLPMPALDSAADCLCPQCLRGRVAATREQA